MGKTELYTGFVKVPGVDEVVGVSIAVDLDTPAVQLDLSEPVGGTSRWDGGSITVRRLLKYDEVHFVTDGLPMEGVILQWKTNLSNLDDTAAGVIIARPNEHRVKGETGFTLSRVERSQASRGRGD